MGTHVDLNVFDYSWWIPLSDKCAKRIHEKQKKCDGNPENYKAEKSLNSWIECTLILILIFKIFMFVTYNYHNCSLS